MIIIFFFKIEEPAITEHSDDVSEDSKEDVSVVDVVDESESEGKAKEEQAVPLVEPTSEHPRGLG